MAESRTSGYVTLSGAAFDETLSVLTDELGFELDRIGPADDPRTAIVSGHGVSLALDKQVDVSPVTLRLETGAAPPRTLPNGVVVEFVDAPSDEFVLPDTEPELAISRAGGDWGVGRAGMRYRDLIPSRLGGRYIASHIEVCDGGPVPDMVHHHGIRFQMIFCHRGWVDVVYEDQGPPFRLEPGDCVLQPPHIRHRVLASSAGAQVVEIGCPAEHDTFFDHGLELPTQTLDTERDFGGQKFVRHETTKVPWTASVHPGFEVQHTAIEQATKGLASVRVLRSSGETATAPTRHDGDFWFLFVLDGSAEFAIDGASNAAPLGVGDSVTVPAGMTWCLRNATADLVLLEVVVDDPS